MTSALPRRFHLQRDHDVSGVSGTGRVANGILWPDGTASLRWIGDRPSTVHWDRLADAEAVHGHGGATRIVWDDQAVHAGGNAEDCPACSVSPTPPPYPFVCPRAATEQPPAGPDALRDRIAKALADEDGRTCGWGHEFLDRYGADAETDGFVDAVLAVLPAPVDQAAVRDALRRADEAEVRAAAMERGMKSTAADALKHQGCHSKLMAQCQRAEHAETEVERLRTMYNASEARVSDLIDERDQLLETRTNRAAVLREAADAVFALEYDAMVGEEGDENLGSMREAWDVGTIHASQLLRRMADETAATEETHVVADDSDDPEHVDDCPGCTAAGARQDGAQR